MSLGTSSMICKILVFVSLYPRSIKTCCNRQAVELLTPYRFSCAVLGAEAPVDHMSQFFLIHCSGNLAFHEARLTSALHYNQLQACL